MKNYAIIILILVLVGGGAYLAYAKYGKTQNSDNSNRPVNFFQKSIEKAKPTLALEKNLVTLTANGYEPATLTIKVGNTVTWVNQSGNNATVSSDPHPAHTNYPPLNLGKFNGGNLFLTFDKAGTYGYHNHLNAEETGTIIVK